jgi:cytochrome b pre-mRNA-processing protein 3
LLYGAIVAQARHPAFYREFGVPDSVEGRFEMIVLHLVLFWRRARADAAMRPLGQAVFDQFCRDMDDNLREMGVGDLAVPKRMQRLGAAFYGRAGSYDRALAAGGDGLAAALARNVFGNEMTVAVARALATYVLEAERALAAAGALAAHGLEFPDPLTTYRSPFSPRPTDGTAV